MPQRSAAEPRDRKSTRLNSSHQIISYAVFCLKKKNQDLRAGLLLGPGREVRRIGSRRLRPLAAAHGPPLSLPRHPALPPRLMFFFFFLMIGPPPNPPPFPSPPLFH